MQGSAQLRDLASAAHQLQHAWPHPCHRHMAQPCKMRSGARVPCSGAHAAIRVLWRVTLPSPCHKTHSRALRHQ
eukprot:349655-Chlamydomonas_euryale.AAC.2